MERSRLFRDDKRRANCDGSPSSQKSFYGAMHEGGNVGFLVFMASTNQQCVASPLFAHAMMRPPPVSGEV